MIGKTDVHRKKQLWQAIRDYRFDDIVPAHLLDHIVAMFGGADASTRAFADKLARKRGWTVNFALRAISEYKKFVYLGIVGDSHVTPSKIVDEVWHQHIQFTKAYRAFCNNVIGMEFDHHPELVPQDDQTEVFNAQFLYTSDLYRKEFGTEPPAEIWGTPKFKTPTSQATPEKKRRKDARKSGADIAIDDAGYPDQPLHSFFDTIHSVTDGLFHGDGGHSGGAGATSSWEDSSSHSGGHGGDTGGGGDAGGGSDGGGGGGGCSSGGCGGGGCGGGD